MSRSSSASVLAEQNALFEHLVEFVAAKLPSNGAFELLCRAKNNGHTYCMIRIPSPPLENLSERQGEVALLAGRGLGNKQVARALRLKEPGVAKHLQGAYEKLGVHSRAALGRLSIGLEESK